MITVIVILFVIVCIAVLAGVFASPVAPRSNEQDDAEWEYGDAWKQTTVDESISQDRVKYVAILRGETGMGYSDTTMQDFILSLGSKGIRATYDSYPLEQINIYVLKVEEGKEEEAIRFLRDQESGVR